MPPKRGRSRTPVSRRQRQRTRTPSRSRALTPPQTRGRSMARATSAVRALSRSAGRAVLGAASRSVPVLGAAMSAYDGYRALRDMATQASAPVSSRRKSVSFTNVKSTGIFSGGSNKYGVMDKHARAGVVQKFEYGRVKTESANNIVYLGHSTAPPVVVLKAAIQALLKKLFQLASISIKSFDTPLTDGQTYNMQVVLWYKDRDGDTITKPVFTIVYGSTTLEQLANLMFAHIDGLAQMPDQFLRLQLFDDYGWAGSSPGLRTSIDLTQVSCEFDMRSYLKIQNRTINSTDNDEADNVDNVPVHGKFFEFKTNGTVYQDYGTAASDSQLVSHPIWGVFNSTPNTTGTKMYSEVPLQSQFAGCKSSGGAHLDAGEIKTSVLKDNIVITWNKLIRVCLAKPYQSTVGEKYTQVWLGKSRLFAFERLLNAQVNNGTRQYNFALEHQFEIGCSLIVKRDFMTAPQIYNSFAA